MKTEPVYGLNQFKLAIVFILLSATSFFSALYFNLNFEIILFYTCLFFLSSFVFAIIGLYLGVKFKSNNAIELRKNRIGLIGNTIIILTFLLSLVIIGIELNKFL